MRLLRSTKISILFFLRAATKILLDVSSFGLSATSQQYFSLRTNQPSATSRNKPAVLFSQNKPAPAISHQPTEQARPKFSSGLFQFFYPSVLLVANLYPAIVGP
jgi:hypothetical protein